MYAVSGKKGGKRGKGRSFLEKKTYSFTSSRKGGGKKKEGGTDGIIVLGKEGKGGGWQAARLQSGVGSYPRNMTSCGEKKKKKRGEGSFIRKKKRKKKSYGSHGPESDSKRRGGTTSYCFKEKKKREGRGSRQRFDVRALTEKEKKGEPPPANSRWGKKKEKEATRESGGKSPSRGKGKGKRKHVVFREGRGGGENCSFVIVRLTMTRGEEKRKCRRRFA